MGSEVEKSKCLLISHYPIGRQWRDAITERVGPADELIITRIIQNGPVDILRTLRGMAKERVYTVVFDHSVRPLLPGLILVMSLIPARERYVVHPDLNVQRIYLRDVVAACGQLIRSYVIAFIDFSMFMTGLLLLRTSSRQHVSPHASDNAYAIYLRPSLWLGVVAGGAISHVQGVINGFVKCGYRIKVYSSALSEAEIGGVERYEVKPRNAYVFPKELNYTSYSNHFGREVLKGHSAPEKPDFVYQRLSIGNVSGVWISRCLGVPYVVEYNGSELWISKHWGSPLTLPGVVGWSEDAVLRHAHLVVAVSEALRQDLIRRGIEDKRILVRANGVDVDVFRPADDPAIARRRLRRRFGLPDDALVFGFVGTFGPWHGVSFLTRTILRVLGESWAHNICFVLVGDGVERSKMEQLLGDSVTGSERVVRTGLIPPADVAPLLAGMDVALLPTVDNPDGSTFFGSPTKFFEYLASGLPVIASRVGQMADIMKDCPTVDNLDNFNDQTAGDAFGVLIESANEREFIAAIKFLATNPDWRRQAGRNARNLAVSRYTWTQHAQSILDRLHHVIDGEKKKLILVNGLHSKTGGGVTYLRNILPHLATDGRFDVHLCIQPSQTSLFESAVDGVTVHLATGTDTFWRLIAYEQFKLPLLARRLGADVCFSPANYGPLLSSRSVILLRNALSVAFVERRFNKLVYWLLVYVATLLSLMRASRAIAVSSYAEKSIRGTRLRAKRISIVSHGVSKAFRPDPQRTRKERELLVVSDFYVQKNLHTLFDAFGRIHGVYPDVTLRLAGAPVDEDYTKKLMAMAADMGIDDAMTFEGSLDHGKLARLYQKCTLFVFPSTVETFGNPLVEAMACGCPIASSNTAAMPEVAGDAAAYFDPFDVDDMARVITELLDDPARREELSKRAVERAKMFSWEETARKTADVLLAAADR